MCGAIPALVIALELESETQAIAAHSRVLVLGHDACLALHQLVVIAEQTERDGVGAGAGDAFDDTCPALSRLVEELGNIHVEFDAAARDLEVDLHLFGLIAAGDPVRDRLGVQLAA